MNWRNVKKFALEEFLKFAHFQIELPNFWKNLNLDKRNLVMRVLYFISFDMKLVSFLKRKSFLSFTIQGMR